jgi:hypothetical protein
MFFVLDPRSENIECFPSVSPWLELLSPSAMREFEMVILRTGVVPSDVPLTPVYVENDSSIPHVSET